MECAFELKDVKDVLCCAVYGESIYVLVFVMVL